MFTLVFGVGRYGSISFKESVDEKTGAQPTK